MHNPPFWRASLTRAGCFKGRGMLGGVEGGGGHLVVWRGAGTSGGAGSGGVGVFVGWVCQNGGGVCQFGTFLSVGVFEFGV